MKLYLLSLLPLASAFTVPSSLLPSVRPNTRVYENFGLDFAEDQAENAPIQLLGEANYKQWAGTVNDNTFLNRQYDVVGRVRELGLLGLTAETGLLSALEEQGLDLETLEELLPTLENLGALSFAAKNQQILINLVAPLLVEGAPLLLPPLAAGVRIGPIAFFGAAAAAAAAEAGLIVNHVQLPLVGLDAAPLAGALLLPVTVALGGVGVALGSLKK